MSRTSVSVDDLNTAACYLELSEVDPGERYTTQEDLDRAAACQRVMAWLDEEIAKRQEDEAVEGIIAKIKESHGVTVSKAEARKTLRKVIRESA